MGEERTNKSLASYGEVPANPLVRFPAYSDAVDRGHSSEIGCAVLVAPSKVVAGSYVQCRIRFTAGSKGIVRGGTLRIALRHVCQWTPPQTTDAKASGYSTASAASGQKLSITGWDQVADQADLFSVMFPWQHVIDVSPVEGSIAPSEMIEFLYGDQSEGSPGVRAQRFEEPGFAFRVFVDPDGSRLFLPLSQDLLLPVVGGEIDQLVLVTPSNAQVGTPTRLLVRAEDCYGNVAARYSGNHTARVEDGPGEQRIDVRLEAGLCWIDDIVFRYPGNRAFQVDWASSNPVRVTAERPEVRTLWGELHGHTLLSDGRGTLKEYYEYAKLVAALDVCAVTDHDFMLSDEAWAQSKAVTNAYNAAGSFVTLQSFEWSGQYDVGGDRNVYFADDDPPIIRSRSFYDYRNLQTYHGRAPQANHVEDLFNWLSEKCVPGSVFVAAHFGGRPANVRWHRPELERLVEAFSEHRRSEHWANTFREGRQLGIVGGGDDHIGRPGNGFLAYTDNGDQEISGLGLVGIQANELTREEVYQALYHRRVYATTGARILLDFTVNGFPMGSVGVVCSGPPVVAVDVHGTSEMAAVQILRDGKIVHEVYPDGAFEFDEEAYCGAHPDVAAAVRGGRLPSGYMHYAAFGIAAGWHGPMRRLFRPGSNHLSLHWRDTKLLQTGKTTYLVRVVQADGHLAVSSPIECEVLSIARVPYDRDGLRTLHNIDFMDDRRFLTAYNRGISAVGQDYNWQWRVHVGLWAARSATQIPGDFIEFGTNRGFMSSAIMQDLNWDSTGRHFYLLDTFSGLDERFVTEEEKRSGILEKNTRQTESGFYTTSPEPVLQNFSAWKNVTIIPGPVPLTLEQVGQGPFAFVHIDMNCAPPEVAALEFVWDRLTLGALILLDDYAYSGYEAQKLAIDMLSEKLGFGVLSLPTGQGLIIAGVAGRANGVPDSCGRNTPEETSMKLGAAPANAPSVSHSGNYVPSNYYDGTAMRAVVEQKRHREMIGGLWEELGSLQMEYLRSQGMQPHHRLLDIGCGCLRLGAKAVGFLDAGKYFGTDINEAFLEVGYEEEILPAGLGSKLPRSNLVSDSEFTFPGIPRQIDFAIAQSVFTHLPLSHLRLCLDRLASHLTGSCTFFFTVFLAPKGRESESIEQYPGITTHPHKDPYHYWVEDIQHAAAGLPWQIELIGQWGHPRNQMMVCARLQKDEVRTGCEGAAPTLATRQLSASEARILPPGAEHYTAYVGPPAQWDFMGATQFRLLTALGLREHHKVLDVGCGSLRAGRFLILYLDAGNYFGIEPNTWLIDDAVQHELGRDLMALKQPRFSATDAFDAESFGVQFDFIVAQSVFSHTGPELVRMALDQIRKSLKPDGLALVTFIHSEKMTEVPIEAPGWTYPGCTTYAPARVLDLISAAKLAGRELPWYHPRQTWYVLGTDPSKLPGPNLDRHLSGGVLRDPEFASSLS